MEHEKDSISRCWAHKRDGAGGRAVEEDRLCWPRSRGSAGSEAWKRKAWLLLYTRTHEMALMCRWRRILMWSGLLMSLALRRRRRRRLPSVGITNRWILCGICGRRNTGDRDPDDGLMDAWMEGWINREWTDGWRERRISVCMCGRVSPWMDVMTGSVSECIDEWISRWRDRKYQTMKEGGQKGSMQSV